MGRITGRFLLPHPPAAAKAVKNEYKNKISATLNSFERIAARIAELKPSTVIVITPHGPCFHDCFYMPSQKRVSGDFSAFGAKKPIYGFDTDLALAELIEKRAREKDIPAGFVDEKIMKQYGIPFDLDHGVLVPVSFLAGQYNGFRLLPISLSGLGGKDHYRLGMLLRECVAEAEGDVVIIGSGDLSHKLTEDGPYGYAEEGPLFDKTVKDLLFNEDALGILALDGKLADKAAQCGLNSYRTVLGTLDGFSFFTEQYSYEGPLGVGYLCAELIPGKARESALTRFLVEEEELLRKHQQEESAPVKTARSALEHHFGTADIIPLPADFAQNEGIQNRGVFVCLKKDGTLRGCIGTVQATEPTLTEEITSNTLSAALKDNRFLPVKADEINSLTITVDFLGEQEEVKGPEDLDPAIYGITVESKGKKALLLPGIEGLDTPEIQIRAAREKAGIHPWSKITLKRFKVKRFE